MATTEVHKRVLFQIDIDIDLSKSPVLHNMFNWKDAAAAISAYFKLQGIKITSTSANGGGNATHIEIQGPADKLTMFVNDFLWDDAPGVVYTPLYR